MTGLLRNWHSPHSIELYVPSAVPHAVSPPQIVSVARYVYSLDEDAPRERLVEIVQVHVVARELELGGRELGIGAPVAAAEQRRARVGRRFEGAERFLHVAPHAVERVEPRPAARAHVAAHHRAHFAHAARLDLRERRRRGSARPRSAARPHRAPAGKRETTIASPRAQSTSQPRAARVADLERKAQAGRRPPGTGRAVQRAEHDLGERVLSALAPSSASSSAGGSDGGRALLRRRASATHTHGFELEIEAYVEKNGGYQVVLVSESAGSGLESKPL